MPSPAIERIAGPGLDLLFHLAPWDRAVLDGESAVITEIRLHDLSLAAQDLAKFRAWCEVHHVVLVTARLEHDRLAEAGFLEAHGFRFIELNYRPVIHNLSAYAPDPAIKVRLAGRELAAAITEIAGQIFETGRFHMDPAIGSGVGNRRYAMWAGRAFENPAQQIMVCETNGGLAGFMVVEAPRPDARFWSLVGLAQGLAGQGLGGRVWRSVLAHHAAEGVIEVSTSISSHNTAVHNLYASLGFRFPAPTMMLHWHPGAAPDGRPL